MEDKQQKIIDRILNSAKEQFFRFGFSKVTSDEIAGSLGISKKTLYKYFPEKDKIIHDIVFTIMGFVKKNIESIVNNPGIDSTDKLKQIVMMLGKTFSNIGKPFMDDLQKKRPELWHEISEFRKKVITENFTKLIDEGMQKGIYRADIDKHVFVNAWLNTVQNIITPDFLSQSSYSAIQVFDMIVKIMFEGMMTEKAKESFK